MDSCIFCSIVAKKTPATIIYETDATLVFRDTHPRAPFHVLVIPKEHVVSLTSLKDPTLAWQLHETIRAVVAQEKVDDAGFRVVVNNGHDGGQVVPHLHYHILAGRKLEWPHG